MRAEKNLLLKEIKDKIDGSTAFFITRYKRMSPNNASDFRISLNKQGGDYEVVRKRIFIKAAEAAGITFKEDLLEGHIGIVFTSSDPVLATKAIFDFSKANDNALTVVAGRFEGQLCTAKDVEEISKLPGKDEMRSQLLSVFEAPMSQTLAVMESLLTSVMHCLENKSQENQ